MIIERQLPKRVLSVFLALLMIFTLIPMNVIRVNAAENEKAHIKIGTATAMPGETVELNVVLEDAPTIKSMSISDITYDTSKMTLSNVEWLCDAEIRNWNSSQGRGVLAFGENTDANGSILKMSFVINKIADDANVSISCNMTVKRMDNTDNEIVVDSEIISGNITINNAIRGDMDNNGKLNSNDAVYLLYHVMFGKNDYPIHQSGDMDGNDKVNSNDAVYLLYHIMFGEEDYPIHLPCSHSMQHFDYKTATCTKDGNIEYWYCALCNSYFGDADGKEMFAYDHTIILATGHTIVIDSAVPATYEHTGLTEGSHCSVCNTIIKAQNAIPKLEKNEYSITYHIANNDKYLQSLNIENPNTNPYTSEDGKVLTELIVDGYIFEGWYDGQGSNSKKVENIPIGTKGNIDLYAKWTLVSYTVQCKSDRFVDESTYTYTVDKGLALPTPETFNYVFTGWTDDEGNLYEDGTIPVGTTGDKKLTPNWTSERNKTFTKPKLDAPIIVEDEDSNTILFTYEIGEIQNVPVYTIHDFGYISGEGISRTEEKEFTVETSDTMMNSFSKSVSNATTKSSNWTLSKDWNESTSIDEQSSLEKVDSKEIAETIAKSNSNTWNVSSGSSGSSSITSASTNNEGWQNQSKINLTGSHTDSSSESNKKYKDNDFQINGNIGYKPPQATGGVEGGIDLGYERKWGSEDTTNNGNSKTASGSLEITGDKYKSETSSNTSQKSSSWNSSKSFGGSSTSSTSKTTSHSISEKIAKTYGYGKTYSQGGSSSETQGLQSTQSEGSEYESAVTYSKLSSETIKSTWTTTGTKAGYHRWVMVGKAHVFAIVGYDMSTESFFTYTYSVMDDTEPLQQFEDYSRTTGSYNDAENGVIPFEVPFEVAEYVAERTCCSDGLKIDQSTGIITGYTGTDDYVVIPEYMNVGGGDVVKVTGISPNAFKGNKKIKEVRLSDFITEIPDNAFENCTSLFGLSGGSITGIGSNAFKNCTSLEILLVDNDVKTIGNNAFAGCEYLLVNAANKVVAEATVNSGAKNIQLYLNGETIEGGTDIFEGATLEVPNETETFALFGYGYTYSGLSIVSDANKTFINKINFADTDSISLRFSSPDVTLNQVSVCTKGIGLVLSADNTNLLMQGNIGITTDTDKSVLSKNITFGESNEKVVGTLSVSGKVYIASKEEATGTEYLAHKGDEIVYIDEAMFDNFLNSHNIVFNANGGTVSENSRTVSYGSAIGTLPVAKKDSHHLIGWFTAAQGGEEITADTIFNSTEDVTYYAHWSENPLSDWVKISDMPEDAKIINRKYSYTQRSYTTSGSSSMNGWTKYDTKSAWSDYGSWSGWQDSSVSSSDSRQVETQKVVASYNYKTVYHYYYYSTAKTNGNTSYTKSSSYPNKYTVTFDKALPKTSEGTKVPKQKYKWSNHHGTGKYMFVYADDPYTTKEVTSTNYKTQYRYRDRSLIYTYYFYKDEVKSSTTVPSGDNISNIQEWVQYRVK
ncbi:MAG: leucine-rich repeat protein [Clostridium sp.]|nr:leucine-rich repeat protein [Clostridium sp.]